MYPTYVYLHHQGFDFYLSNRQKSPEELYCSLCDESDALLGVFYCREALAERLSALFKEGYDLIPCEDYDNIVATFCPPECRGS